MPYDPPNSNEIYFVFSLSGYTAPDANEVNFNFTSLNTVSVDTSGKISVDNSIDTEGEIVVLTEEIDTSGKIYNEENKDLEGAVLNSEELDTAWYLRAGIPVDQDLEGRIIHENSTDVSWGISVMMQNVSGRILHRSYSNISGKIPGIIEQDVEGGILHKTSVTTEGKISSVSFDTSWATLIDNDVDTSWATLTQSPIDSEGKILEEKSINVKGEISTVSKNIAWKTLTEDSIDVEGNSLYGDHYNVAGKISNRKYVDVKWELGTISINTSGKTYNSETPDVSGQIATFGRMGTAWDLLNDQSIDTAWGISTISRSIGGRILDTESVDVEWSSLSAQSADVEGDILNIEDISFEWSILSENAIDSSWKISTPDGTDVSGKILTEESVDTEWELATISVSTSWEIIFGTGFDTSGIIYNGDFPDVSGKIIISDSVDTEWSVLEENSISTSGVTKNYINADVSGKVGLILAEIDISGKIKNLKSANVEGEFIELTRGKINPFYVKHINKLTGISCSGYVSPLSYTLTVKQLDTGPDCVEEGQDPWLEASLYNDDYYDPSRNIIDNWDFNNVGDTNSGIIDNLPVSGNVDGTAYKLNIYLHEIEDDCTIINFYMEDATGEVMFDEDISTYDTNHYFNICKSDGAAGTDYVFYEYYYDNKFSYSYDSDYFGSQGDLIYSQGDIFSAWGLENEQLKIVLGPGLGSAEFNMYYDELSLLGISEYDYFGIYFSRLELWYDSGVLITIYDDESNSYTIDESDLSEGENIFNISGSLTGNITYVDLYFYSEAIDMINPPPSCLYAYISYMFISKI